MNLNFVNPHVALIRPEDFDTQYDFVAYCARMSTQITSDKSKRSSENFIKNVIYKNKHLSVLEHYWTTFAIKADDASDMIYETYLLMLDAFNRADILPNITCNEHRGNKHVVLISVNPRMLYEFDRYYTNNMMDNPVYDQAAYIIYNIIYYTGPIISDQIINPHYYEIINRYRPSTIPVYFIPNTKKQMYKDWERHYFYTFEILTNRATHLEHVRHRFRCSYTAESTRYVNYAKNGFSFVSAAGSSDFYEAVAKEYISIQETLKDRTLARSVLPNSTAIKYVFTTNYKQLKTNFIPLRTSKYAADDIKYIAKSIKEIIENQYKETQNV